MSQSIRQSNLFASEDFTKIYQSFKNVDFQAYDFDTIKAALVTYIKDQYPEDFNDYIESSEFVAIIELLAYLGTSLSFRADLNARENFMDTAERRESIIRLARMVNYQPRRNIPAEGLFKLSGVSTSETLTDSLDIDITNRTIYWNDANNSSSYEQIITILNAAFQSSNSFGKPYKKGTIGDVKTHLYRFNSVPFTNITYPISVHSEGNSYPFDIVNTDFNDGETIFERHPNPENAMHLLYRNDTNGLDSASTGFFLHFKQGTLANHDVTYAEPLENRVEEIDANNVNNNDVFVQKIDDTGAVTEEWTKVPSIVGSNVVYNNIVLDTKTIYSVLTGYNDSISIKYSDGNFGEVPKDTMRTWVRTSVNEQAVFRPEDVVNQSISIPYFAKNGQEHVITLIFSLEYTVSNRSLSETDAEIKENAPQVFYTQDRMVNNEDYNVFPLTRGNEIAKARTVNRTHSGHSRFIDINDPTGQHSDIILFAEDGALYKEPDDFRATADVTDTGGTDDILDILQNQLNEVQLQNFFYDVYIKNYKDNMLALQNGDTENYFDYELSALPLPPNTLTWNTLPSTSKNDTGYFGLGAVTTAFATQVNNTNYRFVKPGSKAKFVDPANPSSYKWVTLTSITGTGQAGTLDTVGPIILSAEINAGWAITEVIPPLRSELTDVEKYGDSLDPLYNYIADQIENQQEFAISYDLYNDLWEVIPSTAINETGPFSLVSPPSNDTSWLLNANYLINEDVVFPEYEFITRGVKFVFESADEIRFFYEPDQKIIDIETGKSLQDEIVVMDHNHAAREIEEWTFDGSVWVYNSVTYTTDIILRSRDLEIGNGITDITLTWWDASLVTPAYVTETLTSVNSGVLTLPVQVYTENDTATIIYDNPAKLAEDVRWNIEDVFIMPDGYVDQRKVAVIPVDDDEDGIPDNPMSFSTIVNESTDTVYFEKITDFDEYEYFRVWSGLFVEYDSSDTITEFEINGTLFADIDLIKLSSTTSKLAFNTALDLITFTTGVPDDLFGVIVQDNDMFYNIVSYDGANFLLEEDNDHYSRIGRSFVQPTGESKSFFYKWKHYAQTKNRIDPSISNIQDMLIMTQIYYDDVIVWKKESKDLVDFPAPLTSEELRIQFAELNEYKMLSDQIVFEAGRFKVLFGSQAPDELQARFKIVKLPNATLSDNEVKSRVIDAIDEFFAIANWDFGEAFYYTELAAYIHYQLQKSVASIVIVPSDAESEFGNLFQIRAEVNEMFISTATVNHIDIVKSLTETNLRIK